MSNSKRYFNILLLIASLFLSYTASAQGSYTAMEKYFSADDRLFHESYASAHSEMRYAYYWIADDSLYTCGTDGGIRIALGDINYSSKTITKGKMLLDRTKSDKLYLLTLTAAAGKPSYTYNCLMGTIMDDATLQYNSTIILEMPSTAVAEQAFDYLQHLGKRNTQSNGNTNDTEPAASSAGGFDSQLSKLINGLKNDYAGLQGSRVADDDVNCTISLEGAKSTMIHTGMLHDVYLNADFGSFNTEAEAKTAYRRVIEKVNSAKGLPTTMVKQEEMVAESMRTQAWIPFDTNNVLDQSMKGFSIQVDLLALSKFDKDLHSVDFWTVMLRIKK